MPHSACQAEPYPRCPRKPMVSGVSPTATARISAIDGQGISPAAVSDKGTCGDTKAFVIPVHRVDLSCIENDQVALLGFRSMDRGPDFMSVQAVVARDLKSLILRPIRYSVRPQLQFTALFGDA